MENYAIEIHIVNGMSHRMVRLSDSVNYLPGILTIETFSWIG